MLLGVTITTASWIAATLMTKPAEERVLYKFIALTNPGGPGWRTIYKKAREEGTEIDAKGKATNIPRGIVCMTLGCIAVYGALLATGYWLFSNYIPAAALSAVTLIATAFLVKYIRNPVK